MTPVYNMRGAPAACHYIGIEVFYTEWSRPSGVAFAAHHLWGRMGARL
jgi:hypothetical protein